jgi:endo-1,4-beta-mannosidase
MKTEKLSLIVDSICKELGIKYCSVNPHLVTLQEDALKLSKMYLQLKEMVGIIQEIEERHNLNGLKAKFDVVIKHLSESDHDLIKLARELKDKIQ